MHGLAGLYHTGVIYENVGAALPREHPFKQSLGLRFERQVRHKRENARAGWIQFAGALFNANGRRTDGNFGSVRQQPSCYSEADSFAAAGAGHNRYLVFENLRHPAPLMQSLSWFCESSQIFECQEKARIGARQYAANSSILGQSGSQHRRYNP